MRAALYTLGCKVNQYETQAMERELLRRGYALVPFDAVADVYIINTCTVTAVSDKKSRNAIRRARRQNPQAIVAVCGCYAQVSPRQLRELNIDVIGGNADRMAFLDLIEQEKQERRPIEAVDQALQRRVFEKLPAGGLAARTRAMLKVEDGCVNFCSYCIIPYARGPVRSLAQDEARAETIRLAEDGYREIVLTGIEISSWGTDLPGKPTLADLVETVCAAAPQCRVRLGSLEPRTVTEEFCRRMAKCANLCPQFHLSLQSGCDETLRRMRRKYDTARYFESVQLLNRFFDAPAITTDLIVGFPQETQEEFSQTLAFLKRCDFAKVHVFPYSIRQGTPAAEMRQVDAATKEQRAHRAQAVAEELSAAYLERCVGKVFPVLFEQEKEGVSFGHAPNYAEVSVRQTGLHNQVRSVCISDRNGAGLCGELV